MNNFLSYSTSFRSSFDGKLIANYVMYLMDMLDTMVDLDIKDKEEFIKFMEFTNTLMDVDRED